MGSAILTPSETVRPLCVDLDGTLIKSDSLYDAFCELLRRNPLQALQAPFWVLGGKARLKAEVAQRSQLDPARLPYNAQLLRYLEDQHRDGRPIYLATGAAVPLAERVAAHLGFFRGVLGTEGKTNLTSENKLSRLKDRKSVV